MLLRHIRYFLAVAKEGNFTRAAETLHVSQPTLSQQIRQLEESLAIRLFDRSGRTVQLTDAGEAWMHYAQKALQDLEAGVRAIHDVETLARGSLRLAMTPTFTVYLAGSLVDLFSRRYPGIHLSVSEMTQEKMEGMLAADQLDMGIAFAPVQLAETESSELFIESLQMVVGRGHPLEKQKTPLSAEMFSRQPLALLNGDFATRQFIDIYCQQHGLHPEVVVEANAISAIIDIVRHGRLATILPEGVAQDHPQLQVLPLDSLLPTRRALLLQRKGSYRSAAARAFSDVLHELIAARFPV